MTFLRSIMVLLIAELLVLVPYSFGYALSNHHTRPVIVGSAALVLTIALGYLLTRRRASRTSHR